MKNKITVYVILNEKANKIDICSVRGDSTPVIRNKLSGINKVLNGNYSPVISSSMQKDILEENRNVADKIYKFEYDEKDLTEHIKNNYMNMREDIKAYIIKEYFDNKEIYSVAKRTKESTLKVIEKRYEDSKDIVKILFKSNIIKINMSIENSYMIMKSFHWLPLTYDNILKTMENKTINIIPDNINERILKLSNKKTKLNKLLEIECVLRGMDNSDELINSLISDKARKIYELTSEK